MAHPPLQGRSRTLVTLALSLATFMQVLDTTIANVAIPTIAGDLGASTSQGTWVITSFGVANAIAVPITGWLAKKLGEVRLFLIATIGFVLSSLLCGIAPSLELLILFRVLQGALAGPMIPLSQSLLLQSYPPEKRAIAMALWTMTIIVAPIFGPILGGWLSDNWHWSWIFFINVPVGVVAAWLSWRELRHRETTILQLPIDKVGLTLLVLGVGCLQMMLDRGKELDWFHSGEIMLYGVVALLSLSYLVVWELTDKHPVIDLSLFRDRNFTVGVISVSVGFMLYFGAIVLMPLLMQTQMGFTATEAGLATAPVGILPVLLSPVIGKNAQRLDMRWVVTVSFLVFALCFWWRAVTFNPDMTFADVVWPQFVQGIALAGFFMPLTTITLSNMKLAVGAPRRYPPCAANRPHQPVRRQHAPNAGWHAAAGAEPGAGRRPADARHQPPGAVYRRQRNLLAGGGAVPAAHRPGVAGAPAQGGSRCRTGGGRRALATRLAANLGRSMQQGQGLATLPLLFLAPQNLARGHNADLYLPVRVGQLGTYRAAHRRVAFRHPGVPGLVHLVELGQVRHEDGGFDNAVLVAIQLGQHLVYQRQGFCCLLAGVALATFRHLYGVDQAVDHHGFGHAFTRQMTIDTHGSSCSNNKGKRGL